jgi:hypothetical protein
MLSKIVVDCMYGFPHGDGDGNIFIPADRYGDGDGHGKAVAGTGMGVQYPPG